MVLLVAGIQMGCVAGEGLLLEYSQREPMESRGKMKAEFTMITMAGSLASAGFVGVFMNGKEYLGTFDWGMSFRSLMAVCFVIATAFIPLSLWCVKEPKKVAILLAVFGLTISDSVPTFLTVFNVVRDQYFFLGEDIIGAVPTTTLSLVINLMVIELAEPGREGLCYGLIGTVMHASQPIATAMSNQVFGLFQPNLSDPRNYLADTPSFRNTVALSYVLAY
ncbi:unnamed protein product, partial [Symbiodinium pilosum]